MYIKKGNLTEIQKFLTSPFFICILKFEKLFHTTQMSYFFKKTRFLPVLI